MSNGPPTPPPTAGERPAKGPSVEPSTTAATTQPDEAGPSSTAANTQPTVDLTAITSYTTAFPSLSELVTQRKWREVVSQAERVDLTATEEASPTRLYIIAPLVLAYLILDDIPAARCVFLRLPHALTSHKLVVALLNLVSATSDRQHAEVYRRAGALATEAASVTPATDPVAPVVATMLASFIDDFKGRTFNLLSKAYTSLPLDLALIYLGLPAEQLISGAEEKGWSYDATTKVFSPKAPAAAAPSASTSSTLAHFDLVARSVSHLEL